MLELDLERDGCRLVSDLTTPDERAALLAALGESPTPGRRDLLNAPAVAEWARSPQVLSALRPWLPAEPRPVRAIFFNKSADVNWLVPWHQDLTIAVRERIDVSGFGPWSVKDGAPHVQPPVELLERMLSLRLHFDDADETNGALQVAPGSHRLGRLSAERVQELRQADEVTTCRAAAGDVLLMRPLLLHASARSVSARPRRVLHVEYASFTLPGGLEWLAEASPSSRVDSMP